MYTGDTMVQSLLHIFVCRHFTQTTIFESQQCWSLKFPLTPEAWPLPTRVWWTLYVSLRPHQSVMDTMCLTPPPPECDGHYMSHSAPTRVGWTLYVSLRPHQSVMDTMCLTPSPPECDGHYMSHSAPTRVGWTLYVSLRPHQSWMDTICLTPPPPEWDVHYMSHSAPTRVGWTLYVSLRPHQSDRALYVSPIRVTEHHYMSHSEFWCVWRLICKSPMPIFWYFISRLLVEISKFIQDTYSVAINSQKQIDLHMSKVKVTGTAHCFLKVQSSHKNWSIEHFQYFFVDTFFKWNNKNLSEQRNDLTKIHQYLTFNM